jgi:hypothetical protein
MSGFMKAVAIIAYILVGGPLVLFLVYAANGGAGGSSSLDAFGWLALIGLGSLFVWGLARLSMSGERGANSSRREQ